MLRTIKMLVVLALVTFLFGAWRPVEASSNAVVEELAPVTQEVTPECEELQDCQDLATYQATLPIYGEAMPGGIEMTEYMAELDYMLTVPCYTPHIVAMPQTPETCEDLPDCQALANYQSTLPLYVVAKPGGVEMTEYMAELDYMLTVPCYTPHIVSMPQTSETCEDLPDCQALANYQSTLPIYVMPMPGVMPVRVTCPEHIDNCLELANYQLMFPINR